MKFPCGICNKSVKNNHKAIQCDSCDLWIHIVCNDISDAEYECLKTEDDPWYCLVCFLKYNLNNVPFTRCDNSELNNVPFTRCDNSELNNVPFTRCDNSELNNVPFTRCDNSELNNVPFTRCDNSELNNVPFTRCDNSELNNINASNSMSFLESLPNIEIVNETSQFSNVSSNEASMEIPSKSCSNYYSVEDFKILNIPKNFNMTHSGVLVTPLCQIVKKLLGLGISPKLSGGIIMLELGCSFRKYIDCHGFTLPFPRKIRDFTEKSQTKKHF